LGKIGTTMIHIVTLFAQNYMVRGLAMIESIQSQTKAPIQFTVLAMDQSTFSYLNSLKIPHWNVMGIPDFPDSDFKKDFPQIDSYAYLIEYNSFNDAKLLSQMLSNGIKVKYAERDFVCNSKNYKRGTLIILKNQNLNNIDELMDLSKKFNQNSLHVMQMVMSKCL
jgi:hypothetical protein